MDFHGNGHQGYSSAAGGSSAAHRARRSAQQPSQDQIARDPRLLPLRFHGELLGRERPAARTRWNASSATSPICRRLQGGGERDLHRPRPPPPAPLPPLQPPPPSARSHPRHHRPPARVPAGCPAAKTGTPSKAAKLAPPQPRRRRGPAARNGRRRAAGAPETPDAAGAAAEAHADHSSARLTRQALCAGVPPRWRTDHRLPCASSRSLSPPCNDALDGASRL